MCAFWRKRVRRPYQIMPPALRCADDRGGYTDLTLEASSMNVTRSLVLLAGLVGALGTGCVARVRTHAYVAHHDVVWVEAPTLVYVDGVYIVQDSDVGVYYVDGY